MSSSRGANVKSGSEEEERLSSSLTTPRGPPTSAPSILPSKLSLPQRSSFDRPQNSLRQAPSSSLSSSTSAGNNASLNQVKTKDGSPSVLSSLRNDAPISIDPGHQKPGDDWRCPSSNHNTHSSSSIIDQILNPSSQSKPSSSSNNGIASNLQPQPSSDNLSRPTSSSLNRISASTSRSTPASFSSLTPLRPQNSSGTPSEPLAAGVPPNSEAFPIVTLDPLPHDKSNYKCRYDPALDSSVVKKSAGPQYRHFKPSRTITSFPDRDPRLRLAYPSPITSVPKTSAGKSALVAGISRSSRGRQTYHSQVERVAPYSYDRNSIGPPPPPPPSAILITLLNKLVTGEQVRNHFSQFGRIAECDLKLDPQTGGSLGICWLRFVNEVSQNHEGSNSYGSAKSRSSSLTMNRGLQDGHRSALEAVKKANGARIGIMLTMGAPQPTSSLRKPSKSHAHSGIKCELDGEGRKCAKAVQDELNRIWPPPPVHLLPEDPLPEDNAAPLPGYVLFSSQSQPPRPSVSHKPVEPKTSTSRTTSSQTDRETTRSSSLHSPLLSSQLSSRGFISLSNESPHPTPETQTLLNNPTRQSSDSAPKMPSAMRNQFSHYSPAHSHSAPLHSDPNRAPDSLNQSQRLPQNELKPDTLKVQSPCDAKPMALKPTQYFRQGTSGGSNRGKVAAGFVAAAQNAAVVAAKKAGIQLSSSSSSSDPQPADSSTGAATSEKSLEHSRPVKKELTETLGGALEDTTAGDEDESESEDEDAREERQKELAREALIHSRQVVNQAFRRSSQTNFMESPLKISVTAVSQPVKRISEPAGQSLAPTHLAKSPEISLLWQHNHIGIDKSIKIEILRRLAINGKPFITIDRDALNTLETELRLRYGQAELTQFFSDFQPEQVMTDGQMWYITFCDFENAQSVCLHLQSEAFEGPRLPLEFRQPISQEYFKALVDNNLQPLPSSGPKGDLKALPESPKMTDEELVKQATEILLNEFKLVFLRDLKNRVVTGRVWESLKEDEKSTKVQPSSKRPSIAPKPSAGDSSGRETIRKPSAAAPASAIMKLPSFAKKKAPQPSATSTHQLPTRNSSTKLSHASERYSDSRPTSSTVDRASVDSTRPSSHRFNEEDGASIASSDLSHPGRHQNSRRSRTRDVKDFRLLSDEEDMASDKSLIKKPEKRLHKRRFKKSVDFTSSEEEASDSQSSKRIKTFDPQKEEKLKPLLNGNGLTCEPQLHEEQNLITISNESLIPQNAVENIIIASSPVDEFVKASSTDPKFLGSEVSEVKTSEKIDDSLMTGEKDDRPLKRIRLAFPSRTATPEQARDDRISKLPSLYNCGLAEDEEDLYYLKLALARLRGGQSLHPPTSEKPVPLENGSGNGDRNKPPDTESSAIGSNVNQASDGRNRDTESEIDREFQEKQLRNHVTGSSRTEGYYHITSSQKAFYLPQRNKAIIDVGAIANSSNNVASASALAASRSTRVNSRRFVLNMEQNKKASASASASIDAVADILKFNQLRTRKKQLKFARSPIHDWGLYAMEMIPAGEMVIEYVGEVVRQAVADRREKAYERMGIGSSYLFRVDDDLVVDATKKGNLGRLINHCCAPNCTAKIITINGEKKIVIYAKVTIELGDEVTYDYHFPKEDIKIPCLCGSAKCKGTLN